MRLASRPAPPCSGASILHCDRDALHAAAPPFTTVQKMYLTWSLDVEEGRFTPMKSRSKKRTPNIVNLTVKRRYLTEREVERLIDCARKHGRYGHRDATMILIATVGGPPRSATCNGSRSNSPRAACTFTG